jgi:large subunit ribosomal protein L10
MARPDKAATVAELTEEFRSSNAAVLTEYRGLSVAQLKELRRSLGDTTTYAVVKNTLTKIAAADAGVDSLSPMLSGPSAIAFIKGDPVEAAKGLRDFAKANPLLVIKGGVMDGRPISAADLSTLADLESREVLLAKLAGAMTASLSGAVVLFAAPLSQTARLIEALRAKAEQDPSILAGGAGTPAEPAEPVVDVAESADAAEPVEAVETVETAEVADQADVTEAAAAESEPTEPSADETTSESSDTSESSESTEG